MISASIGPGIESIEVIFPSTHTITMRNRLIMLLILAVTPSFSTSQPLAKTNQVSSSSEVFAGFHRSVSLLRERLRTFDLIEGEYKQATLHLANIERSLNGIEIVAKRQPQATIPNLYLHTLTGQGALINELAKSQLPQKPHKTKLLRVLFEVDSDLDLKLNYAKSSLGAALRSVQVIVHTLRKGKDENDYEVWYVPKALIDNREYYAQFDRLSSPTDMGLPAGNYYIWAQKGDMLSEKKPVSLGNDNKSRREIDIPLP